MHPIQKKTEPEKPTPLFTQHPSSPTAKQESNNKDFCSFFKFKANTRDLAIDALLYATLFYILSNKQMYNLTSSCMPKLIKDRVILHAMMFLVSYVLIQKMLKR